MELNRYRMKILPLTAEWTRGDSIVRAAITAMVFELFLSYHALLSSFVHVLHRPETFGRKHSPVAHTVVRIISQFKAQTLSDRVGSGHGSKVHTRFLLCHAPPRA